LRLQWCVGFFRRDRAPDSTAFNRSVGDRLSVRGKLAVFGQLQHRLLDIRQQDESLRKIVVQRVGRNKIHVRNILVSAPSCSSATRCKPASCGIPH
jgi:hypothetical protein